jgi:hypothetical protein
LSQGYSKDQTRLFYQENDALVAEKALKKSANSEDKAWAAHAANLGYLIESAEAERKGELREAMMGHR